MAKRIIPLLLCLLFLVGCGELHDCKVVGKETIAPHDTVIFHKVGDATVSSYIHHPRSYILIIEGYTEKGDKRRQRVEVNRGTYHRVEEGDLWKSE